MRDIVQQKNLSFLTKLKFNFATKSFIPLYFIIYGFVHFQWIFVNCHFPIFLIYSRPFYNVIIQNICLEKSIGLLKNL